MNRYKFRSNLHITPFLKSFFKKSKNGKTRPSIRFYRFSVIIAIHLLFVLSYKADIQLLEGSISASRLFGFHLVDVFMAIEVFVCNHEIALNLVIGSLSVLGFYFVFFGRAFCSWVCPYALLGEIGGEINSLLLSRHLIKNHEFNHRLKYLFLLIFLSLAFFSSHLVFELFNISALFSRFIIYGYSIGANFILVVLLVEIFFSKRAWCRYICPLGTTYEILAGHYNAIKISYDKTTCDDCAVCMDECIVPHALKLTKQKAKNSADKSEFTLLGADCTLCGRCIDVCHSDSLKFKNRLSALL